MNRTQLRSWVRNETLVEVDQFSDAAVNDIFNEGLRTISTMFHWPFLATQTTTAFVASQEAYALPADLGRIAAVYVTGERTRLREVGPHDAWERHGGDFPTGTPSEFFIWGSNIHLLPIPDVSSGSITLRYYRQPTLMTDDSHSPEFAPEFHVIVADFACLHIWHREEDFTKAKVYADRFAEGVERMARFYNQRAEDQPIVVGEPAKGTRRFLGVHLPYLP